LGRGRFEKSQKIQKPQVKASQTPLKAPLKAPFSGRFTRLQQAPKSAGNTSKKTYLEFLKNYFLKVY